MTVDEFIVDLNGVGEELRDHQSILTEIGTGITTEMKRIAPVDTGAFVLAGDSRTFESIVQLRTSWSCHDVYQDICEQLVQA